MISLAVENVRSISTMPLVPLRPLTIVVGKNSVGKSSFVRWLPLMAQSLDAPGSTPILWSRRDRKLVDYGSFRETLCRRAAVEELGFRLQDCLSDGTVYEVRFLYRVHERATYLSRCVAQVGDVRLDLRLSVDGKPSQILINEISVTELGGADWTWEGSPSSLVPRVSAVSADRRSVSPGAKRRVEHLTGVKKGKMDVWRREKIAEEAHGWTTAALRQSLMQHWAGTETWKAHLHTIPATDRRLKEMLPFFALRHLRSLLDTVDERLREDLTDLVYVAPFRAEPLRSERSPEPSSTLDSRGEALVSFMEGLSEEHRQSLSDWLRDSLGFSLKLRKEGPYSEIRIQQDDPDDDNITDVGFGIGQVLPVAVHLWNLQRSMFSRLHRPVIIEQPELHLHPAKQGAVGRMLSRLAAQSERHGSVLLVETHSEALISAIGEQIEAGALKQELVQLVVFERTSPVEPVQVRLVEFDEKGYLQRPWPLGFFAS